MRAPFILACVCGLALPVLSQGTVAIPPDLSSDFDEDAVSLQTSYNGQSDSGFEDGAKFTTQQTAKAPVFALGDASGVNTAISFLIMMVDTTEDNNRVLHFLQTDFKANGDKTGISSQTQPKFAYKAPGSFGEKGQRQYSFLLYQQRGSFSASDMPSPGKAFNVKQFQTANGLKNALAGDVMEVDSSGSSVGGASQAPQSSQAPETQTPSSTEQQIATLQTTSQATGGQSRSTLTQAVIASTSPEVSGDTATAQKSTSFATATVKATKASIEPASSPVVASTGSMSLAATSSLSSAASSLPSATSSPPSATTSANAPIASSGAGCLLMPLSWHIYAVFAGVLFAFR